MNLLNIEHVCKVYGEKKIFDDVSYGIHEEDKIGIIGINGTGKSTLLKMIAGIEQPDEGQIIYQNGIKIAYLSQNPVFDKETTVLAYVLDNQTEDWALAAEAKSMLNHLGLSNFDMLTDYLSGGQRKRAALAKTLLHSADLLILDEPTNHIDNEMAQWLENYLNNYRGALIMVTHDRYFLDRVTNKILEIDHGHLYGYNANYSQFLEMKAQREEIELASERKRKSVLRMELEWAKRGCRARTTKQRARLERLETLKNSQLTIVNQNIDIDTVHSRMGKKTIELQHISKSYDGRTIINDFSYIVLKNQRLGIIGPNGCGKSTLMKIINGDLLPDSGTVEIGETIKIGYFAQECESMDGHKRVIDYIKDIAEYIQTKEGRISASQMLERFLFDSTMQYTPIEKLSGGEKRRLYLLKILSQAPNVLILDEPTNDLDIPTLTILEDYLESFSGIVITVSHDRYFLDNIVDRIFAFEDAGHLQQYEGGYTDYLNARIQNPSEDNKSCTVIIKGEEKKKNNGDRRHSVKLKFSYKEQKEYEIIDDEIASIETRLEEIEKETLKAATDFVKLNQLSEEADQLREKLDYKMERWVYLNDLAEKIEAQNRTQEE